MEPIINPAVPSVPTDWMAFYKELTEKGAVPDAELTRIARNRATFRALCVDLSQVKQQLFQSPFSPALTVIYADVLLIPAGTDWRLAGSGLVVIARRIEVGASAAILLDPAPDTVASLAVFASEISGQLTVLASKGAKEEPETFTVDGRKPMAGVSFTAAEDKIMRQDLAWNGGLGFAVGDDMDRYLSHAFIYATLLYDEQPAVALSQLLWIKAWAAQHPQFEELFYRSASTATLLQSQMSARANGATFVPYLSRHVYTELAGAFAAAAAKYEQDYMTLSTQAALTEQNIALAKTMTATGKSEIEYVQALLAQANANYENALAAANKAQTNFSNQKILTDAAAAKFEQIGLPDYQRMETIKAVFGIVSALFTFAAGIAAMVATEGAAAPAAAEAGVAAATNIAKAAETGAAVAKKASDLADVMKKLKKLVEGLKKVYELAMAIKAVAGNIQSSTSQVKAISALNDSAEGVDLTAADGWAVFKIQADDILKGPEEKGVGYAAEYRQAIDILVIYGQSVAATQVAVIRASQQVAALVFQLHYAEEKQKAFENLAASLQAGQAPTLALMQRFYQKYLDQKASLWTALRNYEASYFYWALQPSSVRPRIVDKVSDLRAGIENLTSLTIDTHSALEHFNPVPQVMDHMTVEITDKAIIELLRATGEATIAVPLDHPEFAGLSRLRLNTVRVWIEGALPATDDHSVFVGITTAGNYLDRYKGHDYQFTSKPLNRPFRYAMSRKGSSGDWQFADGQWGIKQVDGTVDQEVAYAYFQPTPFAEWRISLLENNPGLDRSKISQVTLYFAGTAIGSLAKRKTPFLTKIGNDVAASQ